MRKTIELDSKGESAIVEHQVEKEHVCSYDELIIVSDKMASDRLKTSISVFVDCSCEESKPNLVVQFFDNAVLTAEDNFKGWFQTVVAYFIQNGFKIKDNR